MSPRVVVSVVCALVALMLSACGDDATALPAMPQSSVPDAEATVLESEVVTKVEDGCLQSNGQTLVFVEGQAEVVGERLHVQVPDDEDGPGGLVTFGINATDVVPIGYAVQPSDWAEQPADSCEGPYFLAVDFHAPNG